MDENDHKWFLYVSLILLIAYVLSFAVLSRQNVSHLGLWRFLDRDGSAYTEEKIVWFYWPLIKIDEALFARRYSSTLPD